MVLAFALSCLLLARAAVLAKSTVDPAALPWSDLRSALPSGADALVDSSSEAYVDQCHPTFLLPDPAEKSTYDLIDQPSGLCMAAFFCGFEQCCPEQSYLDGDSGTTYSDLIGKLSTPEAIAAGLESGWINGSNPAWALPHKVLFPEVAGDVVAAVQFAKEHGLELSVKNSGHSYTAASTKKGTLLLNMNKFRRYATDQVGIVDCGDLPPQANGTISADLGDQPCTLAVARGKPGVIRIGGGENWDKAYRAVKAHNEALSPDAYKYHLIGGNSATVSPMGWTWSGGLAGSVSGRMFGFGVDQVIQIEAVLPNGEHVRFGPTKWEAQEGFLVPRTTAVSGVCNSNPEKPNESEWIWTDCPQGINFDDLWFAFRGGGGGTWGVVLSVHLQLHDYVPFSLVKASPSCELLKWSDAMKPLMTLFMIDYMLDPDALGITREQSNACGTPTVFGTFYCYGEGMGDAVVSTFKSFISAQNETLASGGLSQTDIEVVNNCLVAHSYKDFAEYGLALNQGTPHEGKIKDDGGNVYTSTTEGALNLLVPKDWILQNKTRFMELVFPSVGGPGNYYAFAGETEFSHDHTTSLSYAHRKAGVMFVFFFAFGLVDYNKALQEMYDFTGTEFPAYVGANHLGPSTYGPLKSDWTQPCPLDFTRSESESLCVPAQEAVWGSENLRRLEAIKKDIDPNGMFDCFRCVANKVTFDDVANGARSPGRNLLVSEPQFV